MNHSDHPTEKFYTDVMTRFVREKFPNAEKPEIDALVEGLRVSSGRWADKFFTEEKKKEVY